MSSVETVRISEIARRSGVPATTLRFYEAEGLIAAGRGVNGYRDYGEDVLERLSFIQGAKQLDLSLPEIAEMLEVVEGDSCTQVRETLRPMLTDRLRQVDERLTVLQHLRDRLSHVNEHVAACPDRGDQCRTECALMHGTPMRSTTTVRTLKGVS